MNILINLILFVLILGVIVLIHEFGHFLFAKLTGVYVYEFSIGMGPKIFWHKPKKSETEYSIRCVPIGGFCALAGEDLENDEEKKFYASELIKIVEDEVVLKYNVKLVPWQQKNLDNLKRIVNS